jgi:glutathione S-transferase
MERSMRLYVTRTSPYARLTRIVVLEKGLQERVEIIEAQTRTPGSPYYRINPSGRVPYLARNDGTGLEDSRLICAWLDNLDGRPRLTYAAKHNNWEYGRLESTACSMLDGIAVWVREMRRPESERSRAVLQHEVERCLRMVDYWEREIGHPLLQGPLNLAQLILIIALDLAEYARMADVLLNRAKLVVWARRIRQVASVRATALAGT